MNGWVGKTRDGYEKGNSRHGYGDTTLNGETSLEIAHGRLLHANT